MMINSAGVQSQIVFLVSSFAVVLFLSFVYVWDHVWNMEDTVEDIFTVNTQRRRTIKSNVLIAKSRSSTKCRWKAVAHRPVEISEVNWRWRWGKPPRCQTVSGGNLRESDRSLSHCRRPWSSRSAASLNRDEWETTIEIVRPTDRQHEGQRHGDTRRKDQLSWMDRRHAGLEKAMKLELFDSPQFGRTMLSRIGKRILAQAELLVNSVKTALRTITAKIKSVWDMPTRKCKHLARLRAKFDA